MLRYFLAIAACAHVIIGCSTATTKVQPAFAAGSEVHIYGSDTKLDYIADKRTESCFAIFRDNNAVNFDCCAMRRIPEARPHITWETDESCAAKAKGQCVKPEASPPASPGTN